jgi:hypothetical protein
LRESTIVCDPELRNPFRVAVKPSKWYSGRANPPNLSRPVMTVTIDLSPDEERRLHERASQLGQDLTGYLQQLIREDLGVAPPRRGRTLAEILAPVHEDFRKSGMTEDELNGLLKEALEESRAERRRGCNSGQ